MSLRHFEYHFYRLSRIEMWRVCPRKDSVLAPHVWAFCPPQHQAILQQQLGVLQLTQCCCYLPRDSIRFHKLRDTIGLHSPKGLPLLPQTPITSPGCHLYIWPTGCRWEVPTIPSLGLINLREQLIECRKTFYLLPTKVYNSGNSQMEERSSARYKEKEGTILPNHPCVHQSGSSPNPILLNFLWRLYYISTIDWIIDHWWSIQPLAPLSSLEVRAGGTESSNP